MLPQPTLAPEDTNLPPPPPRIVTHEGSVRHSVSPVAPTEFELYDPTDNKAINYLYTTTTNLNLVRYKGLHLTVDGRGRTGSALAGHSGDYHSKDLRRSRPTRLR